MNRVLDYFLTDPLRLLYLLGGAGGLWFWIGQWRDRIRIRVRVAKEGRFISEELKENSYIQCEVENIGGRPTSLQPAVILTGYTPKREFQRYEGIIVESERDLPPHKPKKFTIYFNVIDVYSFLLFRNYRFRLTRGKSNSLRFRSARNQVLGPLRYRYELICFKWFGRFNEPMT